MASHKMWSRALLGTSTALVLACSAGGNEQNLLTVQPGPPTTSNGGGPPVIGTDPMAPNPNGNGFDLGDDLGDPVAPMGCQQAERKFDPKIPTVFVLVDRSGTMFDTLPGTNITAWGALRVGVLEVMRELESSVRFGFGAFSGRTAAVCDLEVPAVDPALNNFNAISTLYAPLERPINPDSKETPTSLALAGIAEKLRQDSAEGDKYILFVTDGEPDFCDNGNALCPPDSVVALLQDLSAGVDAQGLPRAPIQTLVFGITSPTASIRLPVLQGFANAGAGLPVAPLLANPGQPYDPNALFDQCNGVIGWRDAFTAAHGRVAVRGESIGTYVTDPALGGTAPVYRPDPNDQAALTEQIRAALAGVKSCTFDLAEDGVQVDLTRKDLGQLARVIVNGAPVPFDPANGWSMLSETAVVLAGEACTSWRNPTIETSISFDFPCDIFVPR